MKLFIFIPSNNWDYCGGVLIVAGEVFEDVYYTVKEYKDKKNSERGYNSFRYKLHEFDSDELGVDDWVLHSVYLCAELKEKKVILENYQYA